MYPGYDLTLIQIIALGGETDKTKILLLSFAVSETHIYAVTLASVHVSVCN
jgi:hypothetical protein